MADESNNHHRHCNNKEEDFRTIAEISIAKYSSSSSLAPSLPKLRTEDDDGDNDASLSLLLQPATSLRHEEEEIVFTNSSSTSYICITTRSGGGTIPNDVNENEMEENDSDQSQDVMVPVVQQTLLLLSTEEEKKEEAHQHLPTVNRPRQVVSPLDTRIDEAGGCGSVRKIRCEEDDTNNAQAQLLSGCTTLPLEKGENDGEDNDENIPVTFCGPAILLAHHKQYDEAAAAADKAQVHGGVTTKHQNSISVSVENSNCLPVVREQLPLHIFNDQGGGVQHAKQIYTSSATLTDTRIESSSILTIKEEETAGNPLPNQELFINNDESQNPHEIADERTDGEQSFLCKEVIYDRTADDAESSGNLPITSIAPHSPRVHRRSLSARRSFTRDIALACIDEEEEGISKKKEHPPGKPSILRSRVIGDNANESLKKIRKSKKKIARFSNKGNIAESTLGTSGLKKNSNRSSTSNSTNAADPSPSHDYVNPHSEKASLWHRLTLAQFGNNSAACLGRKQEQATLASVFQRVIQLQRPELVLIMGPAGCGKTALAQSVRWSIPKSAGKKLVALPGGFNAASNERSSGTWSSSLTRKRSSLFSSSVTTAENRRNSDGTLGKSEASSSLKSSYGGSGSASFASKSSTTLSATSAGLFSMVYIEVKFDQSRETFPVLLEAINTCLDKFLEVLSTEELKFVRDRIWNRLGSSTDQMTLLRNALPVLHKILSGDSRFGSFGSGYFRAGSSSSSARSSCTASTGTDHSVSTDSSKRSAFLNIRRTSAPISFAKSHVYGLTAQHRLRMSICSLLQAIADFSSSNTPFLMILDNLHLADTASMELLKTILLIESQRQRAENDDFGRCNLPCLIVATYECNCFRSADAGDKGTLPCCESCQPLRPCPETIKDLTRSAPGVTATPILKIVIKPLEEREVEEAVADLLRIRQRQGGCANQDERQYNEIHSDERTGPQSLKQLAMHLHKNAQGNAYSVLLLLRLLYSENILYYDQQRGWSWNIGVIQQQLATLETILQLVRRVFLSLSRLAQETLKYASIMGDAIDDSALDLLLQTGVGSVLEEAEQAGLLVFLPQFGGYRFAHDWIRQSAYDLIPENERDELHLRIGRKLWKCSSQDIINKNIFIIVSLLNKGSKLVSDSRERIRLSELNLRAGEKAADVSAYTQASKYLRKGLQLLSTNQWSEEHYDLTLALFSAAAEADIMLGHSERLVKHVEEVFRNGKCTEHKLRAYAVLIRLIGQQDNLEKATRIGVDVIRTLGEGFPSVVDHYTLSKELMKVKLALQRLTEEDILKLPPMRDPVKIVCLKILTLIFAYSYQARSEYTTLVAVRSVLMTLEHGLHENSAIAFATYGMVLCSSGLDVHMGHRYGQLAITIAERGRYAKSYSYFISGTGIDHWTKPLKVACEALTFAARSAMEIGDVETAALSTIVKCCNNFYSGRKLPEVEEELLGCIQLCRLYKNSSNEILALMLLQLLHCYSGRASDPAVLSGDVLDYERARQACSKMRTNQTSFFFFTFDLAYAFGNYKAAYADLQSRVELETKSVSSTFLSVEARFKGGLVLIAMARDGIDVRACIRKAREIRRRLSRYQGPSCRSKQFLMEAELLTLQQKRVKDVLNAYEKALAQATAHSCLNEMALVHERLGEFLRRRGELEDSKIHLNHAIELYRAWGAHAKCRQLEVAIAGQGNRTEADFTEPQEKSWRRIILWRRQS